MKPGRRGDDLIVRLGNEGGGMVSKTGAEKVDTGNIPCCRDETDELGFHSSSTPLLHHQQFFLHI